MWRPQGPISFGGLKGQKLSAQGNALGINVNEITFHIISVYCPRATPWGIGVLPLGGGF